MMGFEALSATMVASLLGAALAGVTILYLLRPKRRLLRVPFAPLWAKVLPEAEGRSFIRRHLRRIISWFFALLMVAAIVLAAGDPKQIHPGSEGIDFLLLMDSSASMAATDVPDGRLSQAIQQASKLVAHMGPFDTMMVVEAGPDIRPLCPFTADRDVIHKALASVQVRDAAADMVEALRFARAGLAGRTNGRIVIISDVAGGEGWADLGLDQMDIPLTIERVGEAGDNLSILSFNVRRYPLNRSNYEVFLQIRSTFEQPVEATVELYGDDVLIDELPITLDAGETMARIYPELAGSGTHLKAVLRPAEGVVDHLDKDNVAYASIGDSQRLDILLVTPGDLFLEAALLINENFSVTTITPAQWEGQADQERSSHDITIFDRVTPEHTGDSPGILYLDPHGPFSPWPDSDVVRNPAILRVATQHPILRWISLKDVNIAAARRLKIDPKDQVLIAGPRGLPLLFLRDEGHRKKVAMAFDPVLTDLPLRIAYPLLILNITEFLSERIDAEPENRRTGTTWYVPVSDADGQIEVTLPNGNTMPTTVLDGRAIIPGRHIGLHTLHTSDGQIIVAGNLADPQESTIAPVDADGGDGVSLAQLLQREIPQRGKKPLWTLLALFALAMISFEWITYHRRWTV